MQKEVGKKWTHVGVAQLGKSDCHDFIEIVWLTAAVGEAKLPRKHQKCYFSAIHEIKDDKCFIRDII